MQSRTFLLYLLSLQSAQCVPNLVNLWKELINVSSVMPLSIPLDALCRHQIMKMTAFVYHALNKVTVALLMVFRTRKFIFPVRSICYCRFVYFRWCSVLHRCQQGNMQGGQCGENIWCYQNHRSTELKERYMYIHFNCCKNLWQVCSSKQSKTNIWWFYSLQVGLKNQDPGKWKHWLLIKVWS